MGARKQTRAFLASGGVYPRRPVDANGPGLLNVMDAAPTPSLSRHRFAILAALATFPLVFVGGAVTSKNAGMAVPDWPLSFGSVNPPGWWQIDQVNYEHGHRLLGASVGILVLILTAWTGVKESRKALRSFAYALLAAVVVQGILGGLRVWWNSTPLALIHGCTAQLFFAAMIVMAVVSSPRWPALTPRPIEPEGYSPRLAFAAFAAVVVQLVLGALVRHLHITIVPHVVWSLAVMAFIHAGMGRVLRSHRDIAFLRIPAVIAAILVVVQMGLGVTAWAVTTDMDNARSATLVQWATPTLHVAVGALILAATAVMAVTVFRITESSVACTSTLPNAPLSAR